MKLIISVVLIVVGILIIAYKTYYKEDKTEKYANLGKKGNILVKFFYSNSCGACKLVKPEWEKLKKTSVYKFEEYDVNKNQSLVKKYALSGVPTILAYKLSDDTLIHRHSGHPFNSEDFINKIERMNL